MNLVEIDLLASRGSRCRLNNAAATDRLSHPCLSRQAERRRGAFTRSPTRTPIPPIPIPLLPGDAEPILDLNAVLHALIDRARYDLVIDYRQPPQPRLAARGRGLGRRHHRPSTGSDPSNLTAGGETSP